MACVILGFATIWCAAVRAGTYDVWSCRLPDGRPAPIEGWRASADSTWQLCASGGPIETQLDTEADAGYWVEV